MLIALTVVDGIDRIWPELEVLDTLEINRFVFSHERQFILLPELLSILQIPRSVPPAVEDANDLLETKI